MAGYQATHDHDQCIDDALDAAADICARRGARLTALRRRVLELVWAGHEAVKAYDLLARLGPGAKPPTIYRALDFLVAHGLVHKLESLNAYVGCPRPQTAHEGQFLICDTCGTVDEIDAPELNSQLVERAAVAGFVPQRQTVEVHGLCAACGGGR
ncbi:MAG: transcriptional repressor [Alphaproteobacteria bacterium]|nr:transcriptional repressor [Alphaproteobacteria bacterium]